MRCPRCQNENPDAVKFCGECGARLDLICPVCQASNPPTNKFCHECGAPLEVRRSPLGASSPQSYTPAHLAQRILTSRTALEGERKQVTVLFADLKGSLELLADRDPEEAWAILDPVVERMMEAVHRYEGTVNQVMGDGVMALFGAPIAHEDHAVRACYAALSMQDSVKVYADEVRRSKGVPIQIRVGLNSGEVVVRSIGSDLRMDYTAVGQTTHLAARMEQLATPGSILLSPEVFQLVEGYVRVDPLGLMAIQGLPRPVDVYELTGAAPARSRLQAAVSRGLTRFVGRDTEMETLAQALERAHAGRGQVVAIVGEPGVGKSRLVYELVHSHRTRGWLVLESGSVSFGKATPYLPVTDLLKAYLQIEDRESRQRVREKVTGKVLTLDEQLKDTIPPVLFLLDALPEDDPFRSLEPPQRKGRTVEALKQLLLRECQRQPVLLVFEDLHWVDAESEAVLDALVESLPTSPMLCLTNYRPEYQDRWGSKTYYGRLRLDPLPAEDADELLGALLGSDPALGGLKAILKERTEGNPFFLEESVRALVEVGALRGEPRAYRLEGDVRTLQVPATVQAVVAARIDRLPADEKRLLQTAAVIGMDVPLDLLRETADLAEDALRQGLAHLHGAEFLYETRLFPETEYTFKHALTRVVAYGSLLQERRRLLHRRVGDLIEGRQAGRLAMFAEPLAGHFEQAEDWGRAATYWMMAAEKAKEGYNYPGAADFCQKALECAHRGQGMEDIRTQGLVLLGDVSSLMGDLEAANDAYDQALEASTDPALRRGIANRRHEQRSLVRDGARIVYYEHGSGDETLVLLHPTTYGLGTFQPVVQQLCQEFRIITLDPRGTGSSDPLPGPYTDKDHVEDFRAVIETASDRPVVAIGNSAGARIVLKLAVAHPALVRSLVLVSPPHLAGGPRTNQPLASAADIPAALATLASRVYSEPGTQYLAEGFAQNYLRLPPETLLSFFAGDPERDVRPLLPHVRVPTLVMRGTADRMGSMESAQYLADHIEGGQFYAFEGRGHALLFTATTEFCEVLRSFLRTGSVPSAHPSG